MEMNFIEVPEWLDSYDEMIKLLCTKINDASESTVFSITDGTSAFIIVLNFKRKIPCMLSRSTLISF